MRRWRRGAVSVSHLVEADGSLVFPTVDVRVRVFNTGQPAVCFCAIPDIAMLAAINREIDAAADDQNALGHDARQKREVEVLADQLSLERDESTPVWKAQAQGLPAEHRADCSAQAILGCRLRGRRQRKEHDQRNGHWSEGEVPCSALCVLGPQES